MRYIFTLIFWLIATLTHAQDWEDRQLFGDPDALETLTILSSTDTALFAPVLQSFTAGRPDVAVDYMVAGTAEIDRLVRQNPGDFDVVISSAMDLQFKLANDGFARVLDDLAYPAWAQWRQSLFAFTSEPAAIVLNRAAFDGFPVPQTRQDLIRALRDRPDIFRGRVGTYDVRQSGLGYLFATQDARTSETYWRLMEVMGNLGTRLYCCSGDMIADVAAGDIVVAYNVLGSYAPARQDVADQIRIIVPEDFQTIMMRTALVSAASEDLQLTEAFMTHIVELSAQSGHKSKSALPLLTLSSNPSDQSTIQLEPALLTYLDRLKAQRFIAEWEDAIIQ